MFELPLLKGARNKKELRVRVTFKEVHLTAKAVNESGKSIVTLADPVGLNPGEIVQVDVWA